MFSYDNIGGKIKGWAKWIFVIEAIASVIGGIALISEDVDMIFVGLLIIVAGPIVAWVSSWILYGFGQLIENSDIIAREYDRKNQKYEKVAAENTARERKRKAEIEAQRREKAKSAVLNPDVADDEFVDITCPNCKEELSYTMEQLRNGTVTCPMCDTSISI